jgi:hypothetical protein
MNTTFPTLEEFLLYKEPGMTRCKTGKWWLLWYQLSKENFESGVPKFGEKVITLVNGHGGNGCDTRVFMESDLPKYYYLPNRERGSLVDKETWYRIIVPVNIQLKMDMTPFRNNIYELVNYIVG